MITAAQWSALEEYAMRSFAIFMFGLAILLAWPQVSAADGAQASQPARKTITGTLTDALGRPLVSVGLELQNSSGKVVAKTKSDIHGRFAFADVSPGVYAVVAKKMTFKPATAIV